MKPVPKAKPAAEIPCSRPPLFCERWIDTNVYCPSCSVFFIPRAARYSTVFVQRSICSMGNRQLDLIWKAPGIAPAHAIRSIDGPWRHPQYFCQFGNCKQTMGHALFTHCSSLRGLRIHLPALVGGSLIFLSIHLPRFRRSARN